MAVLTEGRASHLRISTLAILLLAPSACSSSNGTVEKSSENQGQPNTVEYRLAVVDKGGYVRPGDPVVVEFANVLGVLEERCFKNTRTQIGDYTVSIQKQLLERGVQEDLLTILKAVADPVTFRKLQKGVDRDVRAGSIPTSSQTGDCAAYMTEYVLLRT